MSIIEKIEVRKRQDISVLEVRLLRIRQNIQVPGFLGNDFFTHKRGLCTQYFNLQNSTGIGFQPPKG